MLAHNRDLKDSAEYFNRVQEACDYLRQRTGTNKFDVA